MLPHKDGPSAAAWLIALLGLALPWIGAGVGLAGLWQLAHGRRDGWWLIGAGVAALVGDTLIDLVWARTSIARSDQPDLNRRSAQLVGRVLLLEEAIEAGRGKVRVGDTLWPAEGPDLPAGTAVTVTGVRRDLLVVVRAGEGPL